MQSTTGSLALKRRPKSTVAKPIDDSSASGTEIVQQVISIPLEKLHRHPSNRTIPKESVGELVQSLKDHGQREPIRVREHPDKIGHYEIISGERRFVAAQVAGIDSLHAIVETITDSNSIIDLAVFNSGRQDLDPIERAELLAELIKPVADGGGGMDRDAAGRIFGLNSESGVKNTLRLLKLPKCFRDLLSSGKKPIGEIRPLCAYPDAFLSKLADCIVRPSGNVGWAVRGWLDDNDDTESLIGAFVRELTRPVGDKKHKHYHGYQTDGHREKGARPMIAEVMAKEDRAQVKILRILRLIDRMAGWSYPKTVKEIFDLTSDNYGSERTLYRDIQLLETMGIVHQTGLGPTNRFGKSAYLYQINLSRSERLQEVAIAVGGEA